MDNATAYDMVKKERVIEPYDAKEDIKSGASGGTVFIKKLLYVAIPSRPDDNPESRALYIEKIPEIWSDILAIKDFDGLYKYGTDRFMRSFSQYDYLDKKYEAPYDTIAVYGKRFMNLLMRRSNSAVDNWSQARRHEAYTKEFIDKTYERYSTSLKTRIDERIEEFRARPREDQRYAFLSDKYNTRKVDELTPAQMVVLEEEIDAYIDRRCEAIRQANPILSLDEYCKKN